MWNNICWVVVVAIGEQRLSAGPGGGRHLRGVAYRMLGSLGDAEDAVQETWLRLSRSGAEGVGNFGGWLTTVIARACALTCCARDDCGGRNRSLTTCRNPPPAAGLTPKRKSNWPTRSGSRYSWFLKL